jgi:hypothetical protein
MAERNLASEQNEGGSSGDEWDAAFSRLLEGVNLDELNVPTAGDRRAARLTFGGVRERVADQLREKLRSERLRREAIERLQRQFEQASQVVDRELDDFVQQLLDVFNGGGEARQLPDPRDGRSRTWQVLAHRSPGRSEQREPIVSVLLTMRGMDALDRGQPSLECRVSTPRNPRLVDFTAGADFAADLEDALCRAYQDILGTLRFEPSAGADLGESPLPR